MKLKQTLEESIKFTNKEINLVKREAKDIMIGVEYEYHVYDDKANEYLNGDGEINEREEVSIDEIYDYEEYQEAEQEAVDEMLQIAMDEKESEFRSTQEDHYREESQVWEFYTTFQTLEGILNENPQYKEIFDVNWNEYGLIIDLVESRGLENLSEKSLKELFGYVNKLSTLKELLSKWNYGDLYDNVVNTNIREYVQDDNVKDYIENYLEQFYDALHELARYVDEVPVFAGYDVNSSQGAFVFNTYMDDLKKFMEEDGEDFIDYTEYLTIGMGGFNNLRRNYREIDKSVEEYIERLIDEEWEDEEDSARESASEEIYNSGYYSENIDLYDVIHNIERNHDVVVVNYDGTPYFGDDTKTISRPSVIHNIIDQWDIDPMDIREVTTDPSVANGVETITKALPLNDTLDLMKKMFKHISDIGYTSDKAGMHVNMSIRGLDFIQHDFNPIKLVMLADPKLLREFFPQRSYVGDMFTDMSAGAIMDLAGSSDFLNEFSNSVKLNQKYQGINFNHIKDYIEDRRRIEFRYFGGDGYEQRYNSIEWNIYRFAYILLASFSEGFGDNEYKKAIIRYLDKKIKDSLLLKDVGITSFVELRNIMRKNDIYTYNELYDYQESKGKIRK